MRDLPVICDPSHIAGDSALVPELAQKAMDICPVGALIVKEKGFDTPIGERKYDKKPAGYAGLFFCILGNVMLWIIFLGGLLPPETLWKIGQLNLPISVVTFGIFQGMWWGGCGMLIPLATSMIADVSEINKHKTGVLKDGSYSAVFSFVLKFAMALGMYVNGYLMNWAGYVSGQEIQTEEVIRNLAVITFTTGPVVMLLALPILILYPIDRDFMTQIKGQPEACE